MAIYGYFVLDKKFSILPITTNENKLWAFQIRLKFHPPLHSELARNFIGFHINVHTYTTRLPHA